MLDLLKRILCAILNLAVVLLNGLVWLVNQLLAGIAALANAAIGLLPDMPDAPEPPNSAVLEVANWLFPIGRVVGFAATVILLWLVWVLVSVALRWAKGTT